MTLQALLAGSLKPKGETRELVAAGISPMPAAAPLIGSALADKPRERDDAAGVTQNAPAASSSLERELLIAAMLFLERDRDADPAEANRRHRRLRAAASAIVLPFPGATPTPIALSPRLIDLRLTAEYALKPWHARKTTEFADNALRGAIGAYCEAARMSAAALAAELEADAAVRA